MRWYLAYHVDKGLGIVLTEALDYLSFFAVGEYDCNYGNAFLCAKVVIHQDFPRRDSAAQEKLVRPVCGVGSRVKTHDPNDISNDRGFW